VSGGNDLSTGIMSKRSSADVMRPHRVLSHIVSMEVEYGRGSRKLR